MSSLEVLIIDDEPAIRQVLAAYIGKSGFSVSQAGSGLAGLERLAQGDVDIAICDIQMPDISGLELLRRARTTGVDTSFIMMTAYASVDTAIEAIKAGAADYMIKPLRNEEVMHRLLKIGDLRGLRAENRVLRSLVQANKQEVSFSFLSPAMRELERLIRKVAPTDSTVLVTGDSGTGKGLIARLIHQQSLRADAPFIPVNCGAIPENLMESELFGHSKGSFTGADRARRGLFREADKGTIFLDEIGELPLQLQVKLLHVIEEKMVRAVGSEQIRRADVRIVAATNRDLRKMVSEGTFREDLYFRLSVFHVQVPPLRERRQDIPGLVQFLVKRGAQRLNCDVNFTVAADVLELLMIYNWPGNVREMENVIDRALILAEQGQITCSDLPTQITSLVLNDASMGSASSHPGGILRDQVRRFEGSLIFQAISEADGDRRLAAQKLGIGLSSLYRKLEDYESLGLVSKDTKQSVES